MNDDSGVWWYYELDNVIYRSPAGERRYPLPVQDILQNGTWVPYKGEDRIKPIMFGSEVVDPLETRD